MASTSCANGMDTEAPERETLMAEAAAARCMQSCRLRPCAYEATK